MIEKITSKDNKKLKLMTAAATLKGRKKHGLYLVEGRRMTEEAAADAPGRIRHIFVSETFADGDPLPGALDKAGFSVCSVPDRLFRAASDTVTPQGVSALLETGGGVPKLTDDMSRVLILDGVSEPGNVGAMLRTAEAAGIDAVYMLSGCADIYNPKAVRSTMGSIFRVKFACGCGLDVIRGLKERGFEIAATELSGSVDLFEYAKETHGKKIAAIIGSEARGVSKEALGLSDVRVRIPMDGKVESLNAAVAAGVLMYALRN